MAGRRWSEFLLPSVRGAGGGSSKEENEYLKSEHHHEEGEEGEEGQEGSGEDFGKSGDEQDFGYNPSLSLRSSVSFASLPSYMRAKSGLEMDPDRVRCCCLSLLPSVDCTLHEYGVRSTAGFTVYHKYDYGMW